MDRAAEMISGRDFAEWMAAERSGVLELGAWQRMARICTTVGAAAGTTGLREEQFMPRPGAPAEQSEAHMKAALLDGRTVVYVGHGIGLVRELCENAVVLEAGSIVYRGGGDDAADYYQEEIVPRHLDNTERARPAQRG